MTKLEYYLVNDLEYEKLPNSNNAFCKGYGDYKSGYKATIWLNNNHTKIEDYEFEVNKILYFRSSVSYIQYQFDLFMEDIESLKRFEEK